MNVSAWSIRRPIPSILLFTALTLGGLFAFRLLQVQNFPDIELPAIAVSVSLPGATPTQMETEVTRKIEGTLASLALIEHISSTVVEGVSETTLIFRLEKDMQTAMDEVRNAVAAVRNSLPTDVRDPYVARVTASGAPILTYAINSDSLDEMDLSWFVDDTVGKALLTVRGVGSIARQGGVQREVLIELDPTRLQSLNVTAADVAAQILSLQQDAAGGRSTLGGAEQSLRSIGTVTSAAELARLTLTLGGGRSTRIGDIASVRDVASERRNMALLNGESVVGFQVMKAKGASEVRVAEDVRAVIVRLAEHYPHVKITEVSNSVRFAEEQYSSSLQALYEGAVLTLLVLWLFLRDRRATLVSAVALPLSMVPTFLFMYLAGYALNTVTLLALTLVVGILVDDAIVEVENIVRHLNMGKTPLQAALDAADEIGLAVIATSFALVAVFLPTAFIGGIPGRIFQQFGWTAAVAVLGSLLVARMLTPMMCAYLLKPSASDTTAESGKKPQPLMLRYLMVVGWCLARPFKTCMAAAAFFTLSLLLAGSLPVDFIPADNSHEITVNVTAPPGTAIGATAAIAEVARLAAMQEPEVVSVFTSVGLGIQLGGDSSGGFGNVDNATLVLTLAEHRPRTRQQIEKALRARFDRIPGARFTIGSGDSGEKFMIVLSGDDPDLLQSTALALAGEMRTLPGLGSVSTSASLLRPEIVVRRDPTRAADLGVSTLSISQVLRGATGGEYDTNLAKLNLPSRQIPIRVRLDDHSRNNIGTLSRLLVPANNGLVPLSSVASLSVGSGPSRIDRMDRVRNLTVEIELNGRPIGYAAEQVDLLPTMKRLPAGISRLPAGDFEAQQNLFASIGLAILAGVLCIYVVLVLLLNDFIQPGTILVALPLSAGGASAALWLFNFSLSLPSLIGVIMLMGVVTKNSILLVDYAIVAQRSLGLSRTEAILDACRKRARPIVMTTLAMVFGMLPMAVGLQGDPSFRAPMAVVVIGGLLSSTLLSLLVVPVLYELSDSVGERLRSRLLVLSR